MNASNNSLRIKSEDLEEGRFSRFGLIEWWDQKKLRNAKILVVGAGALGNEILKNLALLGIGQVIIVDMDTIERSNLSRSILFRQSDLGRGKAEVAAERTSNIYQECRVVPMNSNVMHAVGLGVFGWADIIIGALDNREARLWINRAAWKMNRPWIDGAIEGLNGVARVFIPGMPPCYECTLGEVDWKILERRMSCNLLTREEMEMGKIPTTPTISSVIAGIQVQEALKLLHGLPVLAGKGFIFEGMNHTSYVIKYTSQAECFSHEIYEHIHLWQGHSSRTTLNELYDFARFQLKINELTLDFSRDIIYKLHCPRCGRTTEVMTCVGNISSKQGRCPDDGEMREVITIHSFSGKESYGNKTIKEIGLPYYDVFVARSPQRAIQILIAGDDKEALGRLSR